MKHPDADNDPADPLLDAVLDDDAWQTASARLKTDALSAFRRTTRRRRALRAGGVVALCASLVFLTFQVWEAGKADGLRYEERGIVADPAPAVPIEAGYAEHDDSLYLTDEELLAMFPEGSCIFVEIDGQLELIFLDPGIAFQ